MAGKRVVVNDAAGFVFVGDAFTPLIEDLIELGAVPEVLIMEGVEEIVFLRAGNELAEGFFAVGSEGEALDEANFVVGESREREKEGKSERFHGRKAGWGE